LVEVFSGFYFGGDPEGEPAQWEGFIGSEPLLVEPNFFAQLSSRGCRWGFVSGAEPPSARYVLQQRLRLRQPPLIAMGDAPEKPNPTGLISLSDQLREHPSTPVLYLGDTVADVQTVVQARRQRPEQTWLSLAVAPPHLHGQASARQAYEEQLRQAGADHILTSTSALLPLLDQLTLTQD
jgi:HAD superfamily phosphatase